MMMNQMNNNNMGGMMMNAMINNLNQMNYMMLAMIANNQNNNNNQNNQNNTNNNQNNTNINQNNTNNNQNNDNLTDDKLTIVFKRNKKDDKVDFIIKIICTDNELVKDVLDRYCFKTNEKKEDLLFLFNSLKVKENVSVHNLGLVNMSIILVIDHKPMKGGNF